MEIMESTLALEFYGSASDGDVLFDDGASITLKINAEVNPRNPLLDVPTSWPL